MAKSSYLRTCAHSLAAHVTLQAWLSHAPRSVYLIHADPRAIAASGTIELKLNGIPVAELTDPNWLTIYQECILLGITQAPGPGRVFAAVMVRELPDARP